MLIYIVHAEADQAAADDLKAFLKSRGLVVETETGAKGFRHLQPSDVVVALWSDKQVFSNYRMVVERRMLDAWADGQLVLAKLDHSFLPVGLRDLPAIDASFANNRELAVWPQVERAVREAMNRALVEHQAREAAAKQSEVLSKPGGGGGPPAPSRIAVDDQVVMAKKRSPSGMMLVMFGIVILIGGVAWLVTVLSSGPAVTAEPISWVRVSLIGVGAMVILLGLLLSSRRRSRRTATAAAWSEIRPVPGLPPNPAAVFISYSHADDAAVAPVVRLVESTGHSVWIDKTGIHTGDGWAGEIVRAIRAAGGIVVMCSKHAFESDHIKREVYLADRYKKPMVPVFLEEARPPEDFEYFFAGVQWLELFKSPQTEWPAAIGKALKAI